MNYLAITKDINSIELFESIDNKINLNLNIKSISDDLVISVFK
jgi:hypothetical protein